MRFTKLVDMSLYFLAGSVVFAVGAAFIGQLSGGATAQEAVIPQEKVLVTHMLPTSASVKVKVTAPQSCASGVCGVVSTVRANKPVRMTVRSCSRSVKRGIFFRWRRR